MKYAQKILFLLFFYQAFCYTIFCQVDTTDDRGFKVNKTEKEKPGKSYALVYGVSDYEFAETIPPLRYADNDARDFYDFLLSTQLVSDSNNIYLRIDTEAKASTFFNDFGKILQRLQPDDKVIIYFAGHGDVEKNGVSVGYLLGYSCAGGTYAGGDVIDLELLQKFVNRAIELKAKVLLITDACRPGDLPGGNEGRKQTLGYLKSQFTNTIKILSCDQGELSKEMIFPSKGGHGVFTYFLLEALRGMSVSSSKETITLYDVQKYIDDSVRKYTAEKQNPVVLGPRNEVIVKVDSAIRASIIAQRRRILPPDDVAFRVTGGRNYTLSPVDSLIYKKFYEQLRKGILDSTDGKDNAFETYKIATKSIKDKNLLFDMKTDLAAKLEDVVQSVMNSFIRGQFQDYPDTLFDEANQKLEIVQMNLMDSTDFRFNEIRAKRIFFIASVNKTSDPVSFLRFADSLMPNTAFINFEIGRRYSEDSKSLNPGLLDSTFKYLNKAILLSPRWSYPRFLIGNIHYEKKEFNRAASYYQQAISLQPNLAYALFNLALTYKQLKLRDSADLYYKKALALDKSFAGKWDTERKTEDEVVSFGKSSREREINEEKMFAGLLPPDVKVSEKSLGKDAKDGYSFYTNAYYLNYEGKTDSANYWYRKAAEKFEQAYDNKKMPFAYYYTWGFTNQMLGNFDKAKEIYELGLKTDTADLDLYAFGVGWIEDKNEKLSEALKYYRVSAELNSRFYQAYNNIGWVHARMQNRDSAVFYYHKALDILPGFATSVNNLANIHFDVYNDDSAIYYYKMLIPLLSEPNGFVFNRIGISYDYLGEYDSAISYYNKAIRLFPDEPVFYKNIGQTYYNKKEYSEAIQYFEKANTIFADSNKVYINLALSYTYLNNYEKAEKILKQGLSNYPESSGLYTYYYNLGWVSDKQNNLNDALYWYKKSIQSKPGYANGLNNIGYTYDRMGKTDSAIYWYRQAYIADPSFTRSVQNLALLFNDLYKNDSALHYYNRLFQLTPEASVSYEIALLHYYDQQYDSAFLYFEKTIALNPAKAIYRAKAGDTYYEAAGYYNSIFLYERAVNHYKEAIRLDSTEYLSMNRLGVAYIYLGKFKESIETFELALKKDVLYKNTYEYNLACVYSLQNEPEKALDYFKRSLQSGYDDLSHITADSDLDNIRGLPGFKIIIEKYFGQDEIKKNPKLFGK